MPFVMCLSPLYLTRPNCLRELMWAMDMCAADKSKKLCVDAMMGSGRFGCKYQCWLSYRSCAADGSFTSEKEEWVKLNCSENPKSLSEVLSAVTRPTPATSSFKAATYS